MEPERVPAVDQGQRAISLIGAGYVCMIFNSCPHSGDMTVSHCCRSALRMQLSLSRRRYFHCPSPVPLNRKQLKWGAHTCAMSWCYGTAHFMCICVTIHKIGYSTKQRKTSPAYYGSMDRWLFAKFPKSSHLYKHEGTKKKKKLESLREKYMITRYGHHNETCRIFA